MFAQLFCEKVTIKVSRHYIKSFGLFKDYFNNFSKGH